MHMPSRAVAACSALPLLVALLPTCCRHYGASSASCAASCHETVAGWRTAMSMAMVQREA